MFTGKLLQNNSFQHLEQLLKPNRIQKATLGALWVVRYWTRRSDLSLLAIKKRRN